MMGHGDPQWTVLTSRFSGPSYFGLAVFGGRVADAAVERSGAR